jgi:Uma2 family endonuclease
VKPTVASPAPIEYPDSDGKPLSDNTLQFEWIQRLTGNLLILFRDNANVFVGGDLLWYPVQNFDKIRQAPDAFVVFDRPKGYRGSYKQWEEGNLPMTVVFEVRSPNDSDRLMKKKLKFYDEYAADEYYRIDPQKNTLAAYRRLAGQLGPQRLVSGSYTSPRLGIRFAVSAASVAVFYPDGRSFLPVEEIDADRQRANQRADTAEQRADSAVQRANAAEQRANRLVELGRKARLGQASPDELAELERLEEGTA